MTVCPAPTTSTPGIAALLKVLAIILSGSCLGLASHHARKGFLRRGYDDKRAGRYGALVIAGCWFVGVTIVLILE